MARPEPILQLKGVMLTLGGAPLFAGADLTLAKGERACLVGANGAGKSTLMRIAAGLLAPDEGTRALAQGAEIAWMAQEPDFADAATLEAYVRRPSPGRDLLPEHEAAAALASFALDPARPPQGLSGGEARRAALARAFAWAPDVLLLDEPTNHLDIAAIQDLEARLAAFRGACLVISHDRRFLERATTACFWLRQGRVLKLDRGFAAFEPWAEAVEQEDARTLARLETHLKAEEHWLQRGVTARRSRNEGRRRRLMDMRAERRARTGAAAAASARAAIEAESGQASGRLVIEAKGLTKSWPSQASPAVKDLNLRIMRGDRVGFIGPNGAGKTTLLHLLLKQIEPDAGSVRHGAGLTIAYVDQTRASLRPDATVWDTLCPLGGDQVMVRGRPQHVAAYAGSFLFSQQQLRQPVAALSGGERNRLCLAAALALPANLLVLDEPTNDLDMDTLDALEEALSAYDGAVLLVSHDRAFLDGVATQVVGALGGGRWAETPGGFADFLREHPEAPFAPAAAPRDRPAPPPAAGTAPKASRKLSYKDQRRLAALDADLARLPAEIAGLESQLADAALFARDPARHGALARALEAAIAALDAAETEWLTLSALQDQLAAES